MKQEYRLLALAVLTQRQIQYSAIHCCLSIVLFGFWALLNSLALLANFQLQTLGLLILIWLVLMQAIIQYFNLRRFRQKFRIEPFKYAGHQVPKPIMYKAIFWWIIDIK